MPQVTCWVIFMISDDVCNCHASFSCCHVKWHTSGSVTCQAPSFKSHMPSAKCSVPTPSAKCQFHGALEEKASLFFSMRSMECPKPFKTNIDIYIILPHALRRYDLFTLRKAELRRSSSQRPNGAKPSSPGGRKQKSRHPPVSMVRTPCHPISNDQIFSK